MCFPVALTSLPLPRQVSNAEQNDTVSLRERFAGTCGTSAAEHYQLRSSVDGAYQRIVSAMVSSIERLAESDSKYGNKLRLENYAAILTTISRHAKRAPILNHFQDFLVQKRESALQVSPDTFTYTTQVPKRLSQPLHNSSIATICGSPFTSPWLLDYVTALCCGLL